MKKIYTLLLVTSVSFILFACQEKANKKKQLLQQKQTILQHLKFDFINLDRVVNKSFYDEKDGDSIGGWADFDLSEYFNNMKSGIQTFKDSLIPFKVINREENKNKSVLILSDSKRENLFPKQSKRIEINKKYSELYFLHTTINVKPNNEKNPLVNYRIHYKDGTEILFECKKGIEIDDWWDVPSRMPEAIRVYNEDKIWLINTPWKNPNPEKEIAWLQMESTGNAIPMLVAITATNNQNLYATIKSKIDKRISNYKNANLKIALVQTEANINQDLNLKNGEKYCRKAKSMGADIIVFPEMYNNGYAPIDVQSEDAKSQLKKTAVKRDGKFVTHFQNLAKELDVAIVITYLENDRNKLYNTATLFDRHGKNIITYHKVHTLDFYKERLMEPGDDFFVAELDTRFGKVKTGLMICYDREFPESARILMLKGAEVILTPNACGLDPLRLNQFQTRAWENSVVTAMANYVGGKWYNGHSCVYNANGGKILLAGLEEGVYLAEINMMDVRVIRENTFWGNAYRRPHKYQKIISGEVEKPFARVDVFGNKFISSKR